MVIGSEEDYQDCRLKFGEKFDYTRSESPEILARNMIFEIVFDFDPISTDRGKVYSHYPGTVFLDATELTLLERGIDWTKNPKIFGFNGMPGMIRREILEASAIKPNDPDLMKLAELLQTKIIQTDNRVGMVTPRILAMIFNEAYYTWGEGTANREAIDIAMKGGTNYPYGPFEWVEKLGIGRIYRLLNALYSETKDERYKMALALKKEFLQYQEGRIKSDI